MSKINLRNLTAGKCCDNLSPSKKLSKTNLSNLAAGECGAKLFMRPSVDPVLVLLLYQMVQMGAEKKMDSMRTSFGWGPLAEGGIATIQICFFLLQNSLASTYWVSRWRRRSRCLGGEGRGG